MDKEYEFLFTVKGLADRDSADMLMEYILRWVGAQKHFQPDIVLFGGVSEVKREGDNDESETN